MSAGLADLSFLVGRWRGEGTLRGTPVTSRSACAADADGSLRLEAECSSGGRVVHREQAVLREDGQGRVTCVSSSERVGPQTWEVAGVEPGRWMLTHPGFAWEIRREGPEVFTETFDEVRSFGSAERVVLLRHVRDRAP